MSFEAQNRKVVGRLEYKVAAGCGKKVGLPCERREAQEEAGSDDVGQGVVFVARAMRSIDSPIAADEMADGQILLLLLHMKLLLEVGGAYECEEEEGVFHVVSKTPQRHTLLRRHW